MTKRAMIRAFLACLLVLGMAAPVLAQAKHEPKAKAWAEKTLRAWMADAVVVEAVKAQNAKHANLTQAEIDTLDKQWRAETKAGAKPLIDAVTKNALSAHLKKLEDSTKGLVTEIFVMDNKGLNVGQSDITSDYWQGDEAKWQKTFSVGPDAVFVDKVEKDESTQKFQTQVSISIVDPASKQVIGAVTAGLDVEELLNQ